MKISTSLLVLSFASLSFSQDISIAGAKGGQGEQKTPKKPLVDSLHLQRGIKSSNLLNHAKQFVKFAEISNGTRAFGSIGHNATIKYLKTLLDKTNYYDTVYQTFPYLYSDGTATFSANGTTYSTSWFTYGPAGEVTAPIVIVNNLGCELTDYPSSVVGNIALVKRGTCAFGLKTALSGASGAGGIIIYNNADGAIGSGTLGAVSNSAGPYVPGVSLSGIDGVALVDAISSGIEVVGTIHVDSVTETRYSSNLIATSKLGDKKNVVVSGAHTDSVPAGPGINDDGSGTIGLLEIALKLPQFTITNAVRFAFWTAEEFGLVGSTYYVDNLSAEESQNIALYLNFDMTASPNGGHFILDGNGDAFNISGPAGSEKIEKVFEAFFVKNNVTSAAAAFTGRSDYGPFLTAGIPAGGVNTGSDGIKTDEQVSWWGGQAGIAYDPCYHQACDGISNLDVPSWTINTKAAAHAIATFARSLDGIPRNGTATSTTQPRAIKLSYDERRHLACGHEVFGS